MSARATAFNLASFGTPWQTEFRRTPRTLRRESIIEFMESSPSLDGASDEDLMELYYSTPAALGVLYSRYFPRLVKYAARWGVGDDAADVAEEVFVKVQMTARNHKSRFVRSEGTFRAWLYRIAYHEVVTYWRERRNVISPAPVRTAEYDESVDFFEHVASNDPDPLQELEQDQVKNFVRHCIDSLPNVYRQILCLRYLDDLAFEDIVTALEISLGAAQVRVHRAKRMVAECLRRALHLLPMEASK